MDYGIDKDFKAWYAERLKVGGMPNPTDLDPNGRLADREVFINVCDVQDGPGVNQMLMLGARSYWFPLGEIVGLCSGSIYGAMTVLFTAYARDWSVYLHCAAGINRSQTVADCFYYLMTGEHRPRPAHWSHIGTKEQTGVMLKRNCERGKLQPLPIMEAWLKELANTISCIGGGELDSTRMAAGFPWGEPQESVLSGPVDLFAGRPPL
jgi:hypothetical protein